MASARTLLQPGSIDRSGKFSDSNTLRDAIAGSLV
jgi:hypothetical protein